MEPRFRSRNSGAAVLATDGISDLSGFGRRDNDRNEVSAVSAIGSEVVSVHRYHLGIAGQFGHANDAGVRQIHISILIFFEESQYSGQFVCRVFSA